MCTPVLHSMPALYIPSSVHLPKQTMFATTFTATYCLVSHALPILQLWCSAKVECMYVIHQNHHDCHHDHCHGHCLQVVTRGSQCLCLLCICDPIKYMAYNDIYHAPLYFVNYIQILIRPMTSEYKQRGEVVWVM